MAKVGSLNLQPLQRKKIAGNTEDFYFQKESAHNCKKSGL